MAPVQQGVDRSLSFCCSCCFCLILIVCGALTVIILRHGHESPGQQKVMPTHV